MEPIPHGRISTATAGRIEKALGSTSAERYLGRLCEKTFLSLWSYPAVFRDQGKQTAGADGKEVCDLLVIFGDDLIIFSDKDCHYHDSGRAQIDWQRWFRRGIQRSAEQAWGAERWIRQHPDRLFLDRQCTQKLPVGLPDIATARIHLVVVAHGIERHVIHSFPESSGSLVLDTALKGFAEHNVPFRIGDLEPSRTFVHVLDDTSLQTVMSVRDTISDFVRYLSARERLFRGNREICAAGEEQLLAIYLCNMTEKNEHDFIFPVKPDANIGKIHVPEGHWEVFQRSPQRVAQLNEDRVSYLWDSLIERFGFHALRGDQYFVTDGGINDAEEVLRFMAREPRWKRRYLATTILDMLKTTPIEKRRLRVILPVEERDPHYVFLLLPAVHARSDGEYRLCRRRFLEACCKVAKLDYPNATDIVGVATEPGLRNATRSEDALYLNARVWAPELEEEAKELKRALGILANPCRVTRLAEEYPAVRFEPMRLKIGRNDPCPCGSGKKYKQCCLNKWGRGKRSY